LSLKQPFDKFVVSSRKTIELRTWNTHFRGIFLVHASGNVDKEACESFNINPATLSDRIGDSNETNRRLLVQEVY
jgi:hypothetical protein